MYKRQGTDSELLAEEGIADMDAFVALTGLDETNIILAMYASQLNHCKVVAKINRKSFADVVTERGLVDSLVSTGAVTTELIVQYVRAMQNSQATNVRTLHRLVGGKVEALEFSVTADVPFAGVPLRDLNLRKNILVAGIIRENGKTIIPSGNDSFCAGDDVIIVTTNTDLTDLRDIMARG